MIRGWWRKFIELRPIPVIEATLAKCYQGSVGNKAMQEVISAVTYYGGDEGWVITNSFFTPSSKALARKSKVKLIDGEHLKEQKLD
jgi:restriction system protein